MRASACGAIQRLPRGYALGLAVYRIGEFARIARVSPKALRLYDRLGLLAPVRAENGYRFYLPKQLGRLNRILALKDLGLSLEEIGTARDEGLDAELLREKHAGLRRRVGAADPPRDSSPAARPR